MPQSINPFSFGIPQEIQFKTNASKQLPALLERTGSPSAFLLSDKGLVQTGLPAHVAQLLSERSIACTTFCDVQPNPTVAEVDAAAAAFAASGANTIIALGGGSPMDVAKAVSAVATHGGSIAQYEGADKLSKGVIPLIAIPTTAGTGSEVTPFCVIVDTERNYKFTVRSESLLPRHVLLDPLLLLSLPMSVAASTGMDAIVHAIEAYLSLEASPYTDAMAEKALSLLGGAIQPFTACRSNVGAASAMLLGSHFAGLAFARAGLGNVHAMSHPVSAYFHAAHGMANSALLPAVLSYNALADCGRYRKIYECLSNTPCPQFHKQQLLDAILALLDWLELPAGLRALGVTEDKIPLMANDAMKSKNIRTNPRQSTQAQIEALYLKALASGGTHNGID